VEFSQTRCSEHRLQQTGGGSPSGGTPLPPNPDDKPVNSIGRGAAHYDRTPSRIAMGIAIAGGLTFATFLSLFIVPAAYSFFAGKVESTNTIDASKMA
jgi:Cation/multidrug efflux pump